MRVMVVTLPNFEQVGAQLRDVREARKETMKDVAARAGLSYSYVQQVETGQRIPSLNSVRRLCGALDVLLDINHSSPIIVCERASSAF